MRKAWDAHSRGPPCDPQTATGLGFRISRSTLENRGGSPEAANTARPAPCPAWSRVRRGHCSVSVGPCGGRMARGAGVQAWRSRFLHGAPRATARRQRVRPAPSAWEEASLLLGTITVFPEKPRISRCGQSVCARCGSQPGRSRRLPLRPSPARSRLFAIWDLGHTEGAGRDGWRCAFALLTGPWLLVCPAAVGTLVLARTERQDPRHRQTCDDLRTRRWKRGPCAHTLCL